MIEQVDEPYPAFRTTEKGRLLLRLFSETFDEKEIKIDTSSRTDRPGEISSG